jgi:hypothetical protein
MTDLNFNQEILKSANTIEKSSHFFCIVKMYGKIEKYVKKSFMNSIENWIALDSHSLVFMYVGIVHKLCHRLLFKL